MPFLILLLIIVGVAYVPLDAQYWLLSGARDLWLSPAGRNLLWGALGALLVAGIFYSLGWNDLAQRLYHEDVTKAESSYRGRRR